MSLRSHMRIPAILNWRPPLEYETLEVPLGVEIMDAKYCEWCGRNFLRQAQSAVKYCPTCLPTILAANRDKARRLASRFVH